MSYVLTTTGCTQTCSSHFGVWVAHAWAATHHLRAEPIGLATGDCTPKSDSFSSQARKFGAPPQTFAPRYLGLLCVFRMRLALGARTLHACARAFLSSSSLQILLKVASQASSRTRFLNFLLPPRTSLHGAASQVQLRTPRPGHFAGPLVPRLPATQTPAISSPP